MNENKENDLFKNNFVLAILLLANAVWERGTKSYMKNCTGANCPMQYGSVDPATCVAVKECIFATPPKTNSDHIRSMTDEELAKFLLNISGRSPGIMPTGGWLEWLERESEWWSIS